MNVYMHVYNIYRSCTWELCRKDSCFQTAFHPSTWELFLLTVWCQLMVTEAHERHSCCLEVWCPMPTSWQCLNCRKSTLPISVWPGAFSLWRRFKLMRRQQLTKQGFRVFFPRCQYLGQICMGYLSNITKVGLFVKCQGWVPKLLKKTEQDFSCVA